MVLPALPPAVVLVPPPPEGPVQAVKAKAETPASAMALRKALVLLVICELSVR
jgi:hypothetical protein